MSNLEDGNGGYKVNLMGFLNTMGQSSSVTVANNFMRRAVENGDLNDVSLMLEKGANNYNQCMIEASHQGHKDIVLIMLEKGATNYRECMERASDLGHRDIAVLMLDTGLTIVKLS